MLISFGSISIAEETATTQPADEVAKCPTCGHEEVDGKDEQLSELENRISAIALMMVFFSVLVVVYPLMRLRRTRSRITVAFLITISMVSLQTLMSFSPA
jgi:uncharacterized paraquat-inducible protein A